MTILYRSPTDCPNRAQLATMTMQEASGWCMTASTHCAEISRRAEVMTYFGLTPTQERELYEATLDDRPYVPPAYPTELTPAGEQLCIPGTERQPVAGNRQLNLFGG